MLYIGTVASLVSSCGFYPFVSDVYVGSGTYAALEASSEVNLTAYDVSVNQGKGGLQSTGTMDTLVIPVSFTDYPYDDKTLGVLEIAFNGDGAETRYWESVRSFYYESSFGQLTLNADIAPVYETGMKANEYMELHSNSGRRSLDLMREAVSDFVENGGDTSKYDNDQDGYIDALYIIYSCPSFNSEEGQQAGLDSEFWAFTYWDQFASLKEYPVGNAYVFASAGFLHEGSLTGIDAHTYIHETGHLLGLEDYYNYDAVNNNVSVDEKYRYYAPLGGYDMMDYNLLDHNAVSKWLLGWTNPRVVTGDLEFPLRLEMDSSFDTGDFIALVPSFEEYNGTPYGEYIVLELYEPKGLNYLDSVNGYSGYAPGPDRVGLRIYHVDTRLYRRSGNLYSAAEAFPTRELIERKPGQATSVRYVVGANNTPSNSIDEGYRQLELIDSSGKANFSGGVQNSPFYDPSSVFFTAKNGKNRFDMASFAGFFENGTLLNSGDEFGYSLEVESLGYDDSGEAKASVRIERL